MIDISKEIEDILKEFGQEVANIANEEADSVTSELVNELEAASPKKRGEYAKSWNKKNVVGQNGNTVSVVYNEKGSLTHLLERSHLTRNGTSRTKARPHIKSNEEKANAKFLKNLKERISR